MSNNSNASNALPWWEHPDMTQIMELMCLACGNIYYLSRTKDNPYPHIVVCPKCKQLAMPVQEKRDWLKTLRNAVADKSEESA